MQARGHLRQQGQALFARDVLVQPDVALLVAPLELEHLFWRIDPKRRKLCHGGPSYERCDGSCSSYHAVHPTGCTVGWVHTIKTVLMK